MFYVFILGNDNEDMDPEKVEFERIDETEFRNKKTHSAPKIAPSTRTKENEIYSRKKVKCVNKRMSNFHCGSLSCGDVSVHSNGDLDKSSSFMKDGDYFIYFVLPRASWHLTLEFDTAT